MFFCLSGGSAASAFDDGVISHIEYPGWFHESPFFDLVDDLDNAASDGKKGLMVLFTTEGCSYCAMFIQKSLGDAEIAKTVQRNFTSIGMEIFDDAEMVDPKGTSLPIKQFAYQEAVQFAPSLLFYDISGKTILRLTGYQTPERFTKILDYLEDEYYLTLSLRDYLAQNRTENPAAQLLADPLFEKPPYVLDRSHFPATKPLLIIFEATDCPACGDFHKHVLSDLTVRQTLKQFEVVRLDAHDKKTPVLTPDGQRRTPYEWYMSTDLTQFPSLMFFDEKGNPVLHTDALVLKGRMMNSLNFVLERAYVKGWTYQRYARTKSLERIQQQKAK
jgi:thioredoxin-related protein